MIRTVDAKDNWHQAQHQLYGELSQQLHKLWANGKTAQNVSQSQVEAAQVPELTATPPEPPEHYCREHQTKYKRYSRGENLWWSHKTSDGRWCKEV